MGAIWVAFQEGGWGMWAILFITTIPILVFIVERSISTGQEGIAPAVSWLLMLI